MITAEPERVGRRWVRGGKEWVCERLGAQSTLAQPKHSAEGFFFFFLLPDTGEINPPRKNRAGRLSRRRQSSPLFIVCENRSRGSALGWFEETRGEGGVVGGWVGGGRGGPHLNRFIGTGTRGEKVGGLSLRL